MAIDFVKDDEFSFWLPMEIAKSEKGKDTKRIIQGIASTPDEDLQREVVDQRGIDFGYFLKYGYYNNDHKPGFDNKVGQPLECKVTSKGLWTKGFLFKNHSVADAIWELANALEASQSDRKLGFSLQGKVTRRAGRRILKSWIQDIAITTAPINTNTWLDVVKSLAALPADYFCDDSGCFYVSPHQISPVSKSKCGESCVRHQKEKMKKFFGGLAIDESKLDLKKDGEEEEHTCSCNKQEKAFTQAGSGSVITPESLEGSCKDQGWGRADKELANKSLNFDECVNLLQDIRGLQKSEAQTVTELIFTMNEGSLFS